MGKTVNIHESRSQQSKLIQRVLNGEEVIIAIKVSLVVKLIPFQAEGWIRHAPGLYAGQIKIMPNFDDPLEEFEGE